MWCKIDPGRRTDIDAIISLTSIPRWLPFASITLNASKLPWMQAYVKASLKSTFSYIGLWIRSLNKAPLRSLMAFIKGFSVKSILSVVNLRISDSNGTFLNWTWVHWMKTECHWVKGRDTRDRFWPRACEGLKAIPSVPTFHEGILFSWMDSSLVEDGTLFNKAIITKLLSAFSVNICNVSSVN